MTSTTQTIQARIEHDLQSSTLVIQAGQQLDLIFIHTKADIPKITKTFVLNENSIVRVFTAVFDSISLEVVGQLTGNHAAFEHHLLYFGSEKQNMQLKLCAEHIGKNTMSRMLVRGVVVDQAYADVAGSITIAQTGGGTDAHLAHEGLLMSKKARIDSLPGLEIGTDNVKATHSSAVHYVRPEQLFYLQTRGIPEPEARRMIVEGFLQEFISFVHEPAMAAELQQQLQAKQLALV